MNTKATWPRAAGECPVSICYEIHLVGEVSEDKNNGAQSSLPMNVVSDLIVLLQVLHHIQAPEHFFTAVCVYMYPGSLCSIIRRHHSLSWSLVLMVLYLSLCLQSSVCEKIMELLGQNKIDHHQRQVAILSQDSFYKVLTPDQKAKALKGQFNFDHPGMKIPVS